MEPLKPLLKAFSKTAVIAASAVAGGPKRVDETPEQKAEREAFCGCRACS